MRNIGILLLGQILGAVSVIFIKASDIPAALLAGDRLLLAALVLLPFWWRERLATKRAQANPVDTTHPASPRSWIHSIIPGILLGLHLTTWNIGARMTLAANATLVVNLIPLAMPFFAFVLVRERPRLWELLATLIALVGLAYLGFGGVRLDTTTLTGDGICLLSMILVTAYLALARKNSSGGLWTYLVPLYAIGGITSFLVSLPWYNPMRQSFSAIDLWSVLGLTLVCTVGGHSINNWAMRRFHSQVVSLFTITQFIWAATLAWIIFGEIPQANFWLAATIILSACALALVPRILREKRVRDLQG